MRFVSFLFAVLALNASATSQDPVSRPSDGTLVTQTPCLFTSYEQASAFTRRYYSRQEYEATSGSTAVDCLRIRYVSDGLSIVGFIVKPRSTGDTRYPVIVYNRGGFRDIGKIDTWNLLDFYGFASQGFVVLASQYRGSDGGEGRDEVGGADVADVMVLPRLAASLPYADSSNMFLYGLSRGGMMSFLALRRGFPARAIAVVGAVFDVEAFQQRAPKLVASALALNPDYPSKGVALLRERSVMNWSDQISAPLLIIHGAMDEEVPAAEALTFATKLAQQGKRYQLIVYADDNHEAANNRQDRDGRIGAWFKRHARP
jgi:dipeptidyl aminopeptidase/acylaminoacyl peptidase